MGQQISEPIKKSGDIGIGSDYNFGPPKKSNSSVKFFFDLCDDVLLEVLQWGDRYKLAVLEKNGRRFHWLIDSYFGEAPFLRLNLELLPPNGRRFHWLDRYLREAPFLRLNLELHPPQIKISGKEISEKELKAAEIPPYLRFDVKLKYKETWKPNSPGGTTIGEKFEWVQMILQPFKQALTGSRFEFRGELKDTEASDFKDSSTLLDQIDKLLQIFARCRAYKFYIQSYINENTPNHILAAILQFDAIIRCSKFGVEFGFMTFMPTHLPIEAVGNLLNRTNANGQEDNERFLSIELSFDVSNVSEMLDYLKEEFQEAKVATQPFTLKLCVRCDVILSGGETYDVKRFTNEKTGEELSFSFSNDGYEKEGGPWGGFVIEIKRKRIVSKAAKKNAK